MLEKMLKSIIIFRNHILARKRQYFATYTIVMVLFHNITKILNSQWFIHLKYMMLYNSQTRRNVRKVYNVTVAISPV